MQKYLEKIKQHKYVVLVLTGIYVYLGCFVLAELQFVGIKDNVPLYIVWMCMLVLLLVTAAGYDVQTQPYLYLYGKFFSWIALPYFAGYIGSIAIVQFTGRFYLALALFLCLAAGAVCLYLIFYAKKRNADAAELEAVFRKNLISPSADEVQAFSKRQKFYRWHDFILLFLLYAVGKYLKGFPVFFLVWLCIADGYCIACHWVIYRRRYRTTRSAVLHLLCDEAIALLFFAFAVLLAYGVLLRGRSAEEIAMAACCGIAPFCRQNAYACCAVEHQKIREELGLSDAQKEGG